MLNSLLNNVKAETGEIYLIVSFWYPFNDPKFANRYKQKTLWTQIRLLLRVINWLFLSNMFHFSSLKCFCNSSSIQCLKVVNPDQFILLEVWSGPTILGPWTKIDAGLVGGVITEIDCFRFFQFVEFDSRRKHHAYCRNVKLCIKTLFSRFFQTNIMFGKKILQILSQKMDVHPGSRHRSFFLKYIITCHILMWSSQ